MIYLDLSKFQVAIIGTGRYLNCVILYYLRYTFCCIFSSLLPSAPPLVFDVGTFEFWNIICRSKVKREDKRKSKIRNMQNVNTHLDHSKREEK